MRVALIVGATVAVFTALGGFAAWVLFRGSADGEVLTALKRLETTPESYPLGQGQFTVQRSTYERITVLVEDGKNTALVAATLDLEGRYAAGDKTVQVSSLGYELPRFALAPRGWKVVGLPFPRLASIVTWLASRPTDLPDSWRIRVERDQAFIAEVRGGQTRSMELVPKGNGWGLAP